MARIILVLGTPGVGKSALARGLAASLGFRAVDIGALVKRERLYSRFDKAADSCVIDEERVLLRLKRLLSGGDLVVSSHSIGKALKPRWVKLALVLRLDPVVLFRRLRFRGWARAKSWENVESELIDTCLFEAVSVLGKGKVFEIDTTSKAPSRVLSQSLRIVKREPKSAGFSVNWLESYDPIELERRLDWKSSS